ncbi:hypothetical protein [Streptomyces sp. NPDC093984]|uniref:hypothetical protein n=1 Tax=Streptomyces sp. NPDC093984 TaxID=3366052 RepID=UPI00381D80FD
MVVFSEGDLVSDLVLRQGDVVEVEFDRPSAALALELAEPGGLPEELARTARILPPRREIGEDFTVGAHLVEFAILVAGGITADGFIELVKGAISARARKHGAKTRVEQLRRAPTDLTVHLVVRLDDTPAQGEPDGNPDSNPDGEAERDVP